MAYLKGMFTHTIKTLLLYLFFIIARNYSYGQLVKIAPEYDAGIVPNPFSGLSSWYERSHAIANGYYPTTYDECVRYMWYALEPSKDVFNFSVIENDIHQAVTSGRKLGFRIMCINKYETPMGVPSYFLSEGLGDFQDGVFVPYWDNDAFLVRVEKLMQKLGEIYNGDPRISYVDIGIYGNWGEWHMSGISGGRTASLASRKRIADAIINNFSKTRLLALPDMDYVDKINGSNSAWNYIMGKSNKIGVRLDNLGHPWFDMLQSPTFKYINTTMINRWKTAPIVCEFIGGGCGSTDMNLAKTQVINKHVAMVCDNTSGIECNYSSITSVMSSAGYRFSLDSIIYPSHVLPNSNFTFSTTWTNSGVTPAYEKWSVVVELRKNGATHWVDTLSLDLMSFLPQNKKNQVDTFFIPDSISMGKYEVYLGIVEESGIRPAMKLANKNILRDSKGFYLIGNIEVSNQIPTIENEKCDAGLSDISIYPNPTMHESKIYFSNCEISEIMIYSSLGNLVKSINVDTDNNHYVRFGADLIPGIYFIKIFKKGISRSLPWEKL
ncbi:MAG: DUF4832 domain-containing protein [Cytophagaceae bacterium]|nr:DUF4832 domain-containing protein [Cytophagaceae bacterium]MDW8456350.1 DUF4832 domain-containing protein [Cytophagaceae bacterium]